jgi:tRNA U34 2-thiouridine synthase MnmA/TrmU
MRVHESQVLQVKLRHGQQLHDCTIVAIQADGIQIKLHANDQGIAAGQFAVLYDGQACLGSGVISNSVV